MGRLPPAEKLTLAVRKSVRDGYDSNKAKHESEISELLGETWTVDVDPLVVFPYCAEDQKARLGTIINSYIEGAVYKLKYILGSNEEQMKSEINGICHAHSITLDVDESGKISYSGCEVVDGKLELRFNAKNLWSNSGDCLDQSTFFAALNRAPAAPGKAAPMNFQARHSVQKEYEPKIEEQRKQLAEMLQCEELKFNPNFEDVFAKLTAAGKQVDNWDQRIGYYVGSYFEGLVYKMKYLKFGEDDMLREGFQEAVDKNEVCFRVVDKLVKGSYCETVIEGGVLYIQTIPSRYGTNVGDAADKLIDQL